MAARSKARKRALDVLFEADQRGLNVADALELRLAAPAAETPLPPYAEEIVRGVVDNWAAIDVALAHNARGWTVDRMPAVDRAALRVAAWEILFNDDVPAAVAIDEAVALVADLSTDESPAFVNGVLGSVAASGGASSGTSDAPPGDPLH